jgi:putative transposase
MAYLARQDIFYDGATFHITWQCHNHSWFLKNDATKQIYYDLLLKYKDKYGISIYSYSFMSNHPHLTGMAETREGLSGFMQVVNSQFAKKINKMKKRKGQVVMDRFKSPVIQTDAQLLHVMIYGDLNANRQNMVAHPREYKWCSYHYYAEGKADPLITPAPSYLALGNTDEERQEKYRKMVDEIIAYDEMEKKEYSRVYAIGNPDWVKSRYEELQQIKEAKRLAYLARQRRQLYGQPPP